MLKKTVLINNQLISTIFSIVYKKLSKSFNAESNIHENLDIIKNPNEYDHMERDVRQVIAESPMTGFQIFIIVICQLINILDGFDIVIIAYAAPLIGQEWTLSPERLGLIFSAGLFGITIGSFVLAPLADYIGRRKIILCGLSMITLGMLVTSVVTNTGQLITARIFTGLGIGALFASLTTMVVEFSSVKRRNLAVSFFSLGYPIGAILGGLIAKLIISDFGWQPFFLCGGLLSGVLIPIVILTVPESLDFLLTKQPQRALVEVNKVLVRMQLPVLNTMPRKPKVPESTSVGVLLSKPYLRSTLLLWLSFFMSLLVIYFLISWTPQILIGAGLPLEKSILGGILLNAGGGVGMIVLGLISNRYSLKNIIAIYLIAGAGFMALFTLAVSSLFIMMSITALIGFFTYGAVVGLFVFAAQQYPPSARSTGIGWASGMGRIGSIIGPYFAGLMIGWGWERSTYYLVLAVPLIIGALGIWLVRLQASEELDEHCVPDHAQ